MGAYLQLVTPGIPLLGGVPLRRRVRPAGLLVRVHAACSRTRRRPTPTAAPGGPRPPTPSSGRWTRWRGRSASTRSSCGGSTSSPPFDEPHTAISGPERRLGQPRAGARQGARAGRLRRAARRAAAPAAARRHRAARHRPLVATSRCAGWRRPSVLGALNYAAGGWDAAPCSACRTNKVVLMTGTSPHGQGHETSWSMIVADALGVTPDDVEVLHCDTAIAPLGLDTYGSRSVAVGGIAIYHGARQGHRQGPQRSPRTSSRSPRRTSSSRTARSASRARPDQAMTVPALAFAAFTPTTCPTASSRTSRRPRSTTRPTSRGRSARTSAWSRSTRRPAPSTS